MKFNIFKFEKTFGGIDNWYTKSKRWAKKQSPWLSHLITGVIEWLHKLWIDGKILMAMDDLDRQAKTLLEEWEKDDRQSTPHIVETGVFGDEGLSLEITNPIVERRTDSTSTGMAPPSDAQRLQQDEGDNPREE